MKIFLFFLDALRKNALRSGMVKSGSFSWRTVSVFDRLTVSPVASSTRGDGWKGFFLFETSALN